MRRRDRLTGVFVMNTAMSMIVRRMGNLTDVDHRKQRKYKRLDESNKNAESRQQQRKQKLSERRIKVCDLGEYLLVRKHVCEKSNAKRERPDHVRRVRAAAIGQRRDVR